MAEQEFRCPACQATFSTRKELDQHDHTAHAAADNAKWTIAQQAVGGLKCPQCGAEFTTSDQLSRHERREHQH